MLEFDLNNVKKLFRRALAAIEQGVSNVAYLKLAYHYLLKALKLDQTNNNIHRELQVSIISFFASTKRKIECLEGYDRECKGKKFIVADDSESSCSQVVSVLGVPSSTVASSRFLNRVGPNDLVMGNTMSVECQGPPKGGVKVVIEEECTESTIVIGEESDGVVDSNGNPFTSHPLIEDMTMEMTQIDSMVDESNRSVIIAETSFGVVQSPDVVDSNLVPDVNMIEPVYRFSNRRKQGCYLNLHMDSYKKLDLNKEFTFHHPRSLSFLTVRLLRDDS